MRNAKSELRATTNCRESASRLVQPVPLFLFLRSGFLLAVFLACVSVSADDIIIPIVNGDFENPVLSSGGISGGYIYRALHHRSGLDL